MKKQFKKPEVNVKPLIGESMLAGSNVATTQVLTQNESQISQQSAGHFGWN